MNIQSLMKQAKQMQDNISKVEKELNSKEYTSSSNEDKIKASVSAGKITSLQIDSELLTSDNKEILEDLLLVCINDALNKMNKDKEESLGALTGGVKMPGMF